MKNERWIIVFDLETDGPDPATCNPVQLAAVPIDPNTLEIKADQSFNLDIKPDGIDSDEYFTEGVQKTIAWHAKNYDTTDDAIIAKWKKGTPEKLAWKQFCSYCSKYVVDKKFGQWFTEPIPAGYNIIGFDLPILKRLADKYKTKMPMSPVQKLDMYDNLFWWFENLSEPRDFKLDTVKEFLGMQSHDTAHDALSDVMDEALLIQRFLRFHRKQASVEKFRNSFS